MQQHELVAAVAGSAGIGDHEDAERAVRSTVRVFGRRLAGGQTRKLAAQLPPDLASTLPAEGTGERFDAQEFCRRVAEAEGCSPQQARRHARATFAALEAGLTGHEYDHIAAQLPPDYADLLGTEPVQHH
ncbi:DUF2267 domain-containing protein [Pseudonocardia adelaidensis]|uniref:DUF2267 domain-containing protein n=1 Tax=Pseudonocardia adelaidensis TaxID=648754 RepID=A0ABP9NSI8_9PSEU